MALKGSLSLIPAIFVTSFLFSGEEEAVYCDAGHYVGARLLLSLRSAAEHGRGVRGPGCAQHLVLLLPRGDKVRVADGMPRDVLVTNGRE